jgi:hypothetical protein
VTQGLRRVDIMDFDRRAFKRIMLAVDLKIIIGSDFVPGTTRDVTKKGLCIKIPTSRLKGGMLERLEDRVVIYLGDTILYGLVRWYDVENGFFKIGIELDRGSRGKWWDVVGPVAEKQTTAS